MFRSIDAKMHCWMIKMTPHRRKYEWLTYHLGGCLSSLREALLENEQTRYPGILQEPIRKTK
jgi:hypothetical protein